MRSRLYALAYRMQLHEFGGWSCLRWVSTSGALAFLAVIVPWLFRGLPELSWKQWLIVAVGLAFALVPLALRAVARSNGYVCFTPQPGTSPERAPLAPEDKVPLRASGLFEVEGQIWCFADLMAYWRTFASGEHAVMAIVHATKFAGVGRVPENRLGMCYIFVRPESLMEIVPGEISFGSRRAPGLALRYLFPHPASGRRRSAPKASLQRAYLAFADEAARDRVWADLLAGQA